MARADLELTKLQGQALDMLRDGPRYIRSLQAKGLKVVGSQLVDLGLAERCGTPTNKYRNRLRLTPQGQAMLPPDARGEQAAEEAAAVTAGRSDRPAKVGGGRVQPSAPADGRKVQSLRGSNQGGDGPNERAARLALSHRAADVRRGGETLAEAVRRCGRELDAEETAETVATALPPRRSFQPLSDERWGQLAALAARMGVSQSAALDLALGVGIAGLNEDLDEEEAG